MTRISLICVATLLGGGLFAGAALAVDSTGYQQTERPDFSLGVGFDYETGDYDTGSDSDFISVPFYFDAYPTERLDLELIVPYVYQHLEDSDVTTVLYRTPGGYTGSAVRGQRTTADGTTTTTHRDTSESGLGDITLTAGYIVVQESQTAPQVRPTLYLKFPTADEDKGLGTGEFDFGPGLTLSKWLDDWHLFAEGLYVVQGDSGIYDTKDYFNYNAGVGRQFNDSLYGALQLRGATAPADGADGSLEGRVKGVWRIASDVALEGYVGTGLTDSSADFSGSLAVFFDF